MIVFLVHRSNYYKFLGPLIQEAVTRGFDVEVWIQRIADGKKYLDPSAVPEILRSEKINLRKFDTKEDISLELNGTQAKAIFSLHTREHYNLAASNSLFVTLQHGIDSFIETSLEGLCNTDHLCLYSDFWLEWAAQYYSETTGENHVAIRKRLEQKVVLTGFPQMDILDQLDSQAIRAKYGIKPEAKIVLYFPITLANVNGAWPRFFEARGFKRIKTFLQAVRKDKQFFSAYLAWLLGGWNDEKMTAAIKSFSQNNRAFFIVKAREKDPLRPWVEAAADLAVYDESHFPATPLELLSIADVCIHFYSFAALEAAYCGAFGVTVDRPSPSADIGEPAPTYHRLWRKSDQGSAFNAPGVNAWMTIPETIRKLPSLSLSDFQMAEENRVHYVEKFLGPADGKVASHILDLVKA